jgi:hypothetical protein
MHNTDIICACVSCDVDVNASGWLVKSGI